MIPSACPLCGAYAISHDRESAALLAVCDVLVIKALETMGKWIIREDRSRFRVLGKMPRHLAHTLWQLDDATVSKVLRGAWDVVPAMIDVHGCCEVSSQKVSAMLDEYVHDLVITGTPHSLGELHYRFENRLGLQVYLAPELRKDETVDA